MSPHTTSEAIASVRGVGAEGRGLRVARGGGTPGPCPSMVSRRRQLAATRASPRRGPRLSPPRGRAPGALGRPSLTGLRGAPHQALGGHLARRPTPCAWPMKCESRIRQRRRFLQGQLVPGSRRGKLWEGPGRRRGEQRGREGRAALPPGSRGVVRGRPGNRLFGSPSEATASPSPGLVSAAHTGCRAPASAPALGAALGVSPSSPRAARGGSPSGSAAQPLRPPASGRGDRGGSCQARRTIPATTGLALWVRSTRGAASPVLTRRNGASVGSNGDQSAYRVGGSPTPSSAAPLYNAREKPAPSRRPARPRPPPHCLALAAQPGLPGGARFSASMKLSKPSLGDGRVPRPMGWRLRGLRAPSPPLSGRGRGSLAPARRASPHPPGRDPAWPGRWAARLGSASPGTPAPLAPAAPRLCAVLSFRRCTLHPGHPAGP